MSSLRKLITVLELVSEERNAWTPEEIAQQLAMSLPTAYRYVRELYGAGLFARLPGGRYTLGPRIITLDRQMRRTDPLERVGGSLLQALAEETGFAVLVSYFLNDQVLNVYETGPREGILYGRGEITPLFRSSTARIILAFQTLSRQRRIFDRHAGDPTRDLIGADWPSFRRTLAALRREGACRTAGALVPDRIGLAAPLLNGQAIAQGSLTVIGPARRFALFDETALGQRVIATAKTLAQRLNQESR